MLCCRKKVVSIGLTRIPKKSFSSLSHKPQQLYAWGRGDQGQLGLGRNVTLCNKPHVLDFSPVMQDNEYVKQVVCGMNHTVATTNIGGIISFGVNEHGELGLGDFNSRFTPHKVEDLVKLPRYVACGGHHTLCVTGEGMYSEKVELSEDMQVYSWGKNTYGQLGHPKSCGISRPQEITSLRGQSITAIAAGDEFSVVATPKEVIVFGRCDVGQNGLGVEQEDSSSRIPLSGVIRLSTGWGHVLALTKDGSVWSWGANLHSQCGTGQKSIMSPLKQLSVPNVIDIACGSCHSILLSSSGGVWIFGSAADGKMLGNSSDVLVPQLVRHPDIGRAVAVSSGSDHLAVLGGTVPHCVQRNFADDGFLRLWGFGQHGVLGNGELEICSSPQVVRPPNGWKFSSVSCGMDVTIATTSPLS